VAGNAELADALSRELIDIYSNLQTRLCADIVRRLAAGIGSPDWAQAKLDAAGDLRRGAERMLARAANEANPAAATAITNAYTAGADRAMRQLSRSPKLLARVADAIPNAPVINRLVNSLVGAVTGTHLPLLRESLDLYRGVVARASVGVIAGVDTRREAAQRAWEQLLNRGITGFTDKAGRGWELASYVEMATRTATAQAAVEGHLDKLAAAGIDLITISDSPQECARCRPWENVILVRHGQDGPHTVRAESVISDEMLDIQVAGSLDEAIVAGLFHPNCTHRTNAYLPGATRLKPRETTANPQGDVDRQELRALERDLRKAKLLAVGTIDDGLQDHFDAKVKKIQGEIRDHCVRTGLLRQYEREQIGQAR
jgi:hypothetical protein